jgi:hypothetical protein
MQVGEYFQFLESIEIPLGEYNFFYIKSGEVSAVRQVNQNSYLLQIDGTFIEVPKTVKHQKVKQVTIWEPVLQ